MNLYEATQNTHHQAQLHNFGKKMANGTLTKQEWCDWIGALSQVYQKLDPYLPHFLRRSPDLFLDLAQLLPLEAHRSEVVDNVIQEFTLPTNLKLIGGLAYLLVGANCRGGQIIRKKLEPRGYPCNHLNFTIENREAGENWLKRMREFPDFGETTNAAFNVLISLMDEIENRQ